MDIVRLISCGGFGEVHEVAIGQEHFARKTFACPPSAAQNQEARAKLAKRFAREVRIQSRLNHPNIVPILTFNLEDDPPWFTMPLADQSLENEILTNRSREDFDGHIDIAIWQDILSGAEELHRLGYVHRDLKPANVLLIGGAWMLADFGLILPTIRETTILTSSHSAYGSHFYAAPEQAQDFRNVPEQTDIFALGCMLQDCVETSPGRIPFAQIACGGAYAEIIAKCTELDPKKRFPTISSLRAALFDVYQADRIEDESDEDADRLAEVIDNPRSVDRWKLFIMYVEGLDPFLRHMRLQSVSSALIRALYEIDDVLFTRLMGLICEWAKSTGFDWNYCDVVGDRLVDAYNISPVRVRCEIVLSAMELAVSHNRWHVMNQVGSMLGQTADPGLIDRILIEIDIRPALLDNLFAIENVVHWQRERWHPKIAQFLTSIISAS